MANIGSHRKGHFQQINGKNMEHFIKGCLFQPSIPSVKNFESFLELVGEGRSRGLMYNDNQILKKLKLGYIANFS